MAQNLVKKGPDLIPIISSVFSRVLECESAKGGRAARVTKIDMIP